MILMKQQKGFTVVELIVVIVVIAILATISIVGYNWIANDARDTARRAAAKEIQKQLVAFATRKQFVPSWGSSSGRLTSTGFCPAASGSTGTWDALTFVPDKVHTNQCTPGDMLVAANMVSSDFWDKLPKNEEYSSAARHATQALIRCRSSSQDYGLYLFYYVKHQTPEEEQLVNDLFSKCGHRASAAKNAYKMRAAIRVSD